MVCTVTKNTVEKRGENFIEHVNQHHTFWKYLYFLTYLQEKNREDYTGIENAIHEQFIKNQADWVPYEKDGVEVESVVETNIVNKIKSLGIADTSKSNDVQNKVLADGLKTVEGKVKAIEGRKVVNLENMSRIEKYIMSTNEQNMSKLSEDMKTVLGILKPHSAQLETAKE